MDALNLKDSEAQILRGKKVVYHPIEAAILWSDAHEEEKEIFESIDFNVKSSSYKCTLELLKRWPSVHLNAQRIYDGIVNEELCYCKNGIKKNSDGMSLNDPELTIRYVDLKRWISVYYPDEKPKFLFNCIEQKIHSFIDTESISMLLMERDTLRSRILLYEEKLTELKRSLEKKQAPTDSSPIRLHQRSESTYLSIIGALLWLILGSTPSGKPYSILKNLEAVITIILAQYKGYPGLSECNLRTKFAAAKKSLNGSHNQL
ncbi:hypothetical protein [Saezia sanguinis]|nr:hypothetical protein [Saezia sanguinis]